MAAGALLELNPNVANAVDEAIATARHAFVAGVRQFWVPQFYDFDAISLAGIIGAAVPGLGVGTAAVPINPRHPLTLSYAAQTAQAAAHGNFSLGLGLGAHSVEQHSFGMAAVNTIQRLREHLTVLTSIQADGAVKFRGEQITAISPSFPVVLAGGVPYPIYVAAMGPRALQVTGELADGTLPYLAGPRTIEEFIAPTISKVAADAGRPRPRIIAMVPVAVTDDVDTARDEAAGKLASYDTVRCYRTVMDREGVAGAADLAVIGSALSVSRRLRTYVDAGATDLVLSSISTESVAMHRLWSVAANL
jgi:F420-dependent oxidoreductase-like protein